LHFEKFEIKFLFFVLRKGAAKCCNACSGEFGVNFGVDGSVFFGLSPNYFQGVCGLGGEGMCVDGSVDMEELRGNKCPSPESNSGVEGTSEVKKAKRERRGFTRVEKEILEERFNKTQLDDKEFGSTTSKHP
jgi:hypothetical protein